jgi:hypothetical protein
MERVTFENAAVIGFRLEHPTPIVPTRYDTPNSMPMAATAERCFHCILDAALSNRRSSAAPNERHKSCRPRRDGPLAVRLCRNRRTSRTFLPPAIVAIGACHRGAATPSFRVGGRRARDGATPPWRHTADRGDAWRCAAQTPHNRQDCPSASTHRRLQPEVAATAPNLSTAVHTQIRPREGRIWPWYTESASPLPVDAMTRAAPPTAAGRWRWEGEVAGSGDRVFAAQVARRAGDASLRGTKGAEPPGVDN